MHIYTLLPPPPPQKKRGGGQEGVFSLHVESYVLSAVLPLFFFFLIYITFYVKKSYTFFLSTVMQSFSWGGGGIIFSLVTDQPSVPEDKMEVILVLYRMIVAGLQKLQHRGRTCSSHSGTI